jgi:acyl-coenzyme A synthetase/AMP-(fatty) acid ligase
LLSTSGATGSPKLVRLTRAAIVANAIAIGHALALGPAEVAPTSLPIHYSYGLSIVTSHLAAGAGVLLTDDALTSDDFWRACRAHGATSLAGVPYSYQVLRRLDLDRIAPASLRTLTQAGGKLPTAQIDRFAAIARARGGGMYVMYGATEATARMAIATPTDVVERPGSVGRPVEGGRFAIEDGEIVFRGPSVMLGYATGRDELARGDDQGGVLRTGDLGHLDDDGYLYVTGRAKRIAKVFGLRLNLDEIEAALTGAADRPALAVISDDERLIALVEHGEAAQLADVRRALLAHTGLHPSGVTVTAVPVLPRLASGKIDYSALASSSR